MIKTTQDTVYNVVTMESGIIYGKINNITTHYNEKCITINIHDYIIDSDGNEKIIRNGTRELSFEEYAGMVQLIKSQVTAFNSLEDTKDRELELAVYGYLYVNNQEKPYGATRELTPVVEEEVLPVE